MLSNPAKLLRAYMVKTGVYEAKQLAADLDIPIRTIQRLKLECAVAGAFAEIERNANYAMDGVSADHGSNATRANYAMDGATDAAKSATDGVSPSRVEDNNITTNLEPTGLTVRASESAPELTGYAKLKAAFNGSTDRMIETLVAELGGRDPAIAWLENLFDRHGAEAVAETYQMFLGQNPKPRRVVGYWSKTCRTMKLNGSLDAKPKATEVDIGHKVSPTTVKFAKPANGGVIWNDPGMEVGHA